MNTLNESCVKALEKIGEIVFPERINWSNITKHMTGYNKQRAIQQMVEAAKEDPLMTRLKLFLVWTELDKLRNNGGLLSER